MTPALLRQLRRTRAALGDRRGASAVEFAIIALPLVTLLIGFFEFAILAFAAALMESAALDAARFGATGQVPNTMTRQEKLMQIVDEGTLGLIDMDQLEVQTLIYDDFDVIGQPEGYDDENGNGEYDPGEPYQDVNGNGTWDEDQGRAGLGSGDQIVVYKMEYPWTSLTGLMAPFTDQIVLTSSIPVRNEPF